MFDAHAHIGFAHRKYPLYVKTPEKMVSIMDQFGIEQACVSSLRAVQDDFRAGNRELKMVVDRWPNRFIPFCVVNPRDCGAGEELRNAIRDWGWAGLALDPVEQHFPADCYSVFKLLELAEGLGVPVFIQSCQQDYGHPARIARLAERFPGVAIIMGSMGRMLAWYDAVEAAVQYGNIVLDLTDAMPCDGMVELVVREIGECRVVAGTNLPLSYPAPNIEMVRQSSLSERVKSRILSLNIRELVNRSEEGENRACDVRGGE